MKATDTASAAPALWQLLQAQRQQLVINGQALAVDGGFDAAGVGLPTLRRRAEEAAKS